MIKANTGPSLSYSPLPERILSAMRKKQAELDDSYALNERERFIFEYAWREAMLESLKYLEDIAALLRYEAGKDTPPTYALFKDYLERMAKEIELDNALSPFINYED